MKQTNNALKFLLAQYRAIFKHAYVKGLASAVLLTAGLALAGTAQAVTEITNADIIPDTTTGVRFDGEINSGDIYLDAAGNSVHDLTINGGSLNSSKDTISKPLMVNGTLTVTANGELNLKTDGKQASYGYGVWGWDGKSEASGEAKNISNHGH
ncbi:MAG: hypothetical protein H9847_04160 [Candidatus Anaerobiospirillum pullicola]|uniref:Autotransporter outer membrane beta-barrel domain-containing protein n=1 Tax=Candidatus Anaerobiospirillum pullicola TaxID=2838451 RepID=A0A948TFX3_9GAMM|nr:hypothetical protein [Candidatus Anaerobiospirillum pullicola]